MTGLVKSELRRLLSRRIVWGITAIYVGLMLLVDTLVYFLVGDDEEAFPVAELARSEFDSGSILSFIGGFMLLAGFVIGASSIGADIKSGVLELLLTWEPRRLRLIGVRLLVGLCVTGLIAMFVATLFTALFWLGASLRDEPTTVPDGYWPDVVTTIVRLGLVVGVFFCIGLGLALMFKSTVGAIVGFFIYAFIGENLLRLWNDVWPWTPLTNAGGFMSGQGVPEPDQPFFAADMHHSAATSGLVVLIYAAVIVGGALVIFRRRDVT